MEKIIVPAADVKMLKSFTAGPKDNREALEGVNIRGNKIEATDGHALLIIDTGAAIGAPDGVYRIIATNKIPSASGVVEIVLDKMDVVFPDTERVIPAPGRADESRLINITIDRKAPANISACVINLFKLSGGAYSAHLIERLAPVGAVWTASKPAGANAPVRLDCDIGGRGYIAAIMPFNLVEVPKA